MAKNKTHKLAKEKERLTKSYAEKGKDFTKTEQYKKLDNYLDDVSFTRGGNMGGGNKFHGAANQILTEAQNARNKGEEYVIDPELFTQNKAGTSNTDDTGKLREGMTSEAYGNFMRELYGANPQAMEKAFPWSSGKNVGNLMNLLPGVGTIGRGLRSIYDAGRNKFSQAGGIFDEADEEKQDIVTNTPDNINSGDYLAEKYGKQDEDLVTNILDLKKNRVDQKTKENGIMEVAELTDDQKRFIDLPRNSLDFQSLDSLYKKIMTPQGGFDDGFLGTGFGGQEDTTKEELKDYLGIQLVADGGYMSSFPHQNIGTQSLTASDNIDDRIMKNLEFEKMAPGMMGYNTGGLVEPMEPDYSRGI
tara:strand:+ start:3975 stop:5054 length:1080 start_codon:yes stop_codon:yes gene_type:complete